MANAVSSSSRLRVAVIGGGVMGLSIGWRLAQGGASVDIFERGAVAGGATRAAAGMLAACAEAEPGEERLLELARGSQALWPGFAAELEAASGLSVDLRTEGTLVAAFSADDAARLRFLLDYQRGLGLPVEWINAAQARRHEPHLAAGLAGALWSPEDHQVDNRKVGAALAKAAAAAGCTIHENSPVSGVSSKGGKVDGVTLGEAHVAADIVVLAAGAWSREIEGLPERAPIRPVKGQMIALQMDVAAPLIEHVVWAPGIYMVPRRDGRLILGGTVEEKGFDTSMTAGGVLSLLEAAWRAVPSIEDLPIAEMWVGFRPGSRDDAPLLGRGPLDGLIYATGHYRHGILLTPVTADLVSRMILEGAADPLAAPFAPDRFAPPLAAE